MNRRTPGLGLWLLLLLSAAWVSAWAEQATLVADAHVNVALPAVNSGALSNINVGGGYTGLLQFDLGLLPVGTSAAQISRAVLRLYVNRVDTPGLVSLQPVGGAWAEYGVTYQTLPPLGSAVSVFSVAQGGGYVAVDVTALVQGWVASPAGNHGVALTGGTVVAQFDSKENDFTGHAPALDVEIVSQGPVGPAGVDGPQGPAGVAGASGPAGAPGSPGPVGATGAVGPAGATGAQGPSGFTYVGTYNSATNYVPSNVVLYNGSSYISLVGGNRGNTPDQSAAYWGLVASGATGTMGGGPSGTVASSYQGTYNSATNYNLNDIVLYSGSSYVSLVSSNHGNTPGLSSTSWGLLAFGGQGIGPQGPAGPAGANGAQGLPGLGFEGAYASANNYGLDDVVSWQGSSYISLLAGNHGNTPSLSPNAWALLAAAGIGTTGATGATGAIGPQGPAGLPGATGITGAQGPTGPTGVQGLPGLVYQGAYSSATNYTLGDVVLWQGASWTSLVSSNHGNTPSFSPAYWGVLTQQGPMGATGATGAAGPMGATGALGPVGPPGERGDQGLQGIPGQAGAQGLTGAAGAQGLSGPMGQQGIPGPVGVTFQGVYSSTKNYAIADGVSYNGSSYVSLVASNHGNTPDQSPMQWNLFAAAGASGAQGLPGLVYQGAYSSATNYELGDVVLWQGASWTSLVSSNHGNTPSFSPSYWGVLTQQGPAGATGATGAAGPTGATGALGPVGPPGERGDQGLQGVAGQAGAQGLTGAMGAQGLSGPMGPQGIAGPVGLQFQGAYRAGVNYALADGVNYNGSSYVSLVASNHGNTPDQSPSQWALFAAAGATGATGAVGPAGIMGSQGPQGERGQEGLVGAAGATGPQGPPVINYTGNYSSATNYGLNDGASYGGSTYVSIVSGNHGNTPDQSPLYWSVLVAKGDTGVAGPAGGVGPQGPAGAAGVTGATGASGPPVSFLGGWLSSRTYLVGDAVAYGGGSYIALTSNSGREPDISPTYWSVLAQAGNAGPAGPQGSAGLQGPTGYPGPAGPAGATGSAGPQGVAGPMGAAGPGGLQGVAGPQGSMGLMGAQGPAGAAGAQGASGPPVTFLGGWLTNQAYAVGAGVSYAGASYIALVANSGREPDVSPTYWGLLAQAGSAGPAGPQGATGLEGPTGYPGPAGPAGAMGSVGPQGVAGPAGATGPTGSQGVAGPQGSAGVAGLAYQGSYNSSTNYGLNDGVVFNGSTYISLVSGNAGNTPGAFPAFWALLAAAGAQGVAGAAGTNGTPGAAGPVGATGPQGPQGVAGTAGVNGAAGLTFQGGYSSATNYALNDAVSYGGSSYISLMAGNHGNVPDASPAAWAVLAQAGATGVMGASGPAGGTGATGPQGVAGAQGPVGATGAAGINFRGAWVTGNGYALNDGVTYGGSTYLAQMANNSVQPDTNANVWAVLASAGAAGPAGPGGAGATVAVGSVTTGAAGSSAVVTNSGTAGAAVLNFTIPQGAMGAAGSGGTGNGGGSTSGIPFAAMYHAVSYAATYYSVNNTNQAANETASVLTWVPGGCSATKLVVYSQQAATITVTMRVGMPGSMLDSALSCQVSTGSSCVATGSVTVPAGGFVDIGITHPDSNPVGVWTALSCN